MAGKHRKSTRKRRTSSRDASLAKRGLVPGLMGAAVGATTVSTALMTGTTTSVAPPAVTLAALVTPANSTSQIFAGTTYYGVDQTTVYGDQVLVPFFLGPQGIVTAVDALDDDPSTPDAIFASGWGAGQASTALGMMNEDQLDNLNLVVLDNNTNRAGGGFWTTYAVFAPLLLTSAEPTPNDLPDGVHVVDVAYQYNINSNAPTNPLNPFATTNSLVAYVYGYGGEQTAPVLAGDRTFDDLEPGHHYIIDSNGNIVDDIPLEDTDITYVTVQSDGLPLVRPLRSIPGGDILADALEPTLTELVEAGYQDGESIPEDPSVPRPMNLFPSAPQTSGLLQQSTEGTEEDLSSPNGALSPLNAETNDAPLQSLPKLPKPIELIRGPIDMTSGNRATTGASTGSTSSTRGVNPVSRVVDRISSAANDVADNLTNGANEDSNDSDAEAP
jgi:hypothetical protein